MQPNPTYLAAFAALFAAYIGFQQWKVAKDKLKLDLYNRRFAIYIAALELLNFDERNMDEAHRQQIELVKALRESIFLFDRDSGISKLLDDLLRSCRLRLKVADERSQTKADDDGIRGRDRRDTDYLESLIADAKGQYETGIKIMFELEDAMSAYLSFHKQRGLWEQWLHIFE